MTSADRLKLIFDRVLSWPPEEQELAAEALALIEARRGEVYVPADDEWAAIKEGLADIAADRIASDDEMAAVWKRFGA
ncbi:MAG: hypothetical protein J0H08_16675 [Rhizobiales bacterium]|nr:hypothetical protein [Hyphomicrobiales bacterium]